MRQIQTEIDVLLGGRASEEVFIGEISTGAGNDLDRATMIIKDMITVYGMSDVAGLMVLKRSEHSFLGGAGAITEYSEKMSEAIDTHIKATLEEHYEYVKQTLRDYSGAIEKMTEVLLDVEVIEGNTVLQIIDEYEKEHNMPSRLINKPKAEDESSKTKEDHTDSEEEK